MSDDERVPNCMLGYPVYNQHDNCPYSLMCATCDMDEPDCHCLADGQPMTELGVMHKHDCEWLKWFRVPGCMADDLPIEGPDE
jgi:hypothetical protein